MLKVPQLLQFQPESPTVEVGISWDDVRLFILVAECGSLRQAAAQARVNFRTIKQRLNTLESRLGKVLFVAHERRGIALTKDGIEVLECGRRMSESVRPIEVSPSQLGVRSTVRIGATEGLGSFWIAPRAIDFLEQQNDIQIELNLDMNPPNVAAMEVDIGISLNPPPVPNDRLVVEQLGWLHVVMFASQRYIDRRGYLDTMKNLDRHRFIEIVAPQIDSDSIRRMATVADKRKYISLRLTTGSAQLVTVLLGGGITALPTYTIALTDALKHVAPDYVIRRSIFMSYNPRATELARVRKSISWLKRSFDPDIYPWFRENYVPPNEINDFIARNGMERMFDLFAA